MVKRFMHVAIGLALPLLAGCHGGGSDAPSAPTTLPTGNGDNYTAVAKTDSTCQTPITRTWSATITQSGTTATLAIPAVNLNISCGLGNGNTQNQMLCPATNGGPAGPLSITDPADGLKIVSDFSVAFTVSGNTIAGTFSGQFGTCKANNHSLTFTHL